MKLHIYKKNLKSQKTSFILFLLFIWSVYAAWAFDVQSSISTSTDHVIRYDHLLLPFLVLFTVFAIFILISKKDTDNK